MDVFYVKLSPERKAKASAESMCVELVIMFQVCEFQNDCMYNWPGKGESDIARPLGDFSLCPSPHVPEIWKETGSLANQDLALFFQSVYQNLVLGPL